MNYLLTDADLVEAERRARRYSGAYTGTAGTIAGLLLHAVHTIRQERKMKTVDDERVRYETGAVRSSDAEATRYDLVSPIGLEAVARAAADGAAKYSDYNWEAGMPVSDLLNHAIRHVYRYLAGDRSEDHLGHAAWNLLGAIHSEAVWPGLNEGRLRGPGCTAPGKAPSAK